MRVVVLGASGRTGRHVVVQALQRGHRVTAVVRSPARLADLGKSSAGDDLDLQRLHVYTGDVFSADSLMAAFALAFDTPAAAAAGGDTTATSDAAARAEDEEQAAGGGGSGERCAVVSALGFCRQPPYHPVVGYTRSIEAVCQALHRRRDQSVGPASTRLVVMTSHYTDPAAASNTSWYIKWLLIPFIRPVLVNMAEMEAWLQTNEPLTGAATTDAADSTESSIAKESAGTEAAASTTTGSAATDGPGSTAATSTTGGGGGGGAPVVDWTVVRPPGLSNAPLRQDGHILERPGAQTVDGAGANTMPRANVAAFLLDQLESSQYSGQIVAIAM